MNSADRYRAAFPDNLGLEIRIDRLEHRISKYGSMLAGAFTATFAIAVWALVRAYK